MSPGWRRGRPPHRRRWRRTGVDGIDPGVHELLERVEVPAAGSVDERPVRLGSDRLPPVAFDHLMPVDAARFSPVARRGPGRVWCQPPGLARIPASAASIRTCRTNQSLDAVGSARRPARALVTGGHARRLDRVASLPRARSSSSDLEVHCQSPPPRDDSSACHSASAQWSGRPASGIRPLRSVGWLRARSTTTSSAARSGGDDAGAAGPGRPAAAGQRRTSSSSAADTPGSTPPASSPGAASRSRSSRPRRSAGAPRPATAGSSTPATSGAPRELIERYGEDTGRALYQETLDGYQTVKRLIAEEAIDCDFREVGHLELAYAPSHVPGLEHARESLASVGVDEHARAARADPRGDRLGCLLRGARRRGQRAAPPGPLLRGAGRGRRPRRRRPARGRPRPDDPAPGRRPLRRRDRPRRDPRPRRPRRHQRLHGRRRCRRSVAGSSRSAATSSPASRCPRTWPASSRPRAARSSTRRTSCTTGTSRRTGGWSSAAGRASCRPRSTRRRAILHKGLLEVHPQLAGYRIDYAWGGNVGFTFDRMPHVGRTKDGVAYLRRAVAGRASR